MTKSEELAKLLGSEVKDKILQKGVGTHMNCGGRIDKIERTYSKGRTHKVTATLLECQKCLAWSKAK